MKTASLPKSANTCCGKMVGATSAHGHLNISHAAHANPQHWFGFIAVFCPSATLEWKHPKNSLPTVFHSTRRKEFVRIFSGQVQIQEAAASSGSRTPFSKPKESGRNFHGLQWFKHEKQKKNRWEKHIGVHVDVLALRFEPIHKFYSHNTK